VLDAPAGSPVNAVNFQRGPGIDTVVLGFGLEQLEDPAARAAVVAASLAGFGV
jgi:hypothetical protein